MNKFGLLLFTITIIANFSFQREIKAESVGQFYWHVPSIVNYTDSVFSRNVQSAPVGVVGFTVAVGDAESPKHLADIGLDLYSLNVASGPRAITRVKLGYVYHWSNDYDTEKASHNIHIGVGANSLQQAISGFTTCSTSGFTAINRVSCDLNYTVYGLYARIAYFYARPQSNNQFLVGFNLEINSYIGEGQTTITSSAARGTIFLEDEGFRANLFNNNSLALVFGINF